MKNCWLRLPVLCCTYGRNLDPTSLHISSIKIVLSSSTHRNRHPDGYTQIDQQTCKNSSYISWNSLHFLSLHLYQTIFSQTGVSSTPYDYLHHPFVLSQDLLIQPIYIYTRIVIMPGIIHPFVKESIFLGPYCMHETLERVPIRPTSPITARLALPTAT